MRSGDSVYDLRPFPASLLASRLVAALGRPAAHRALDVALSKFTVVELASLAATWEFWARPKQLAPIGDWRSWGFLTARAFGKTFAIAHFINTEVQAGRAKCIGLAAQNETKTIAVQVAGLLRPLPVVHAEMGGLAPRARMAQRRKGYGVHSRSPWRNSKS